MYVRDFLFLAFSLIALYFHYFLIKELYLEKSATLLFFFYLIKTPYFENLFNYGIKNGTQL